MLCFEEVVLEDQKAVMGYHALRNEIPGRTRSLRGSCWPVPKSAALKGLFSATHLFCLPQNLKLYSDAFAASKAVTCLKIHDCVSFAWTVDAAGQFLCSLAIQNLHQKLILTDSRNLNLFTFLFSKCQVKSSMTSLLWDYFKGGFVPLFSSGSLLQMFTAFTPFWPPLWSHYTSSQMICCSLHSRVLYFYVGLTLASR